MLNGFENIGLSFDLNWRTDLVANYRFYYCISFPAKKTSAVQDNGQHKPL